MAYASLLGSALAYALFFWFANREDLTGFSTLGFLTPVFALASGGVLWASVFSHCNGSPCCWCCCLSCWSVNANASGNHGSHHPSAVPEISRHDGSASDPGAGQHTHRPAR